MKLRWFIKDNGERVLQELNVKEITKEDIQLYRWEDVPEFKMPEKTVTITEEQFWEIYNCYTNESVIRLFNKMWNK